MNSTDKKKFKTTEDFILGILFFTPLHFVKKENYLSIKVYGPKAINHTLEIVRVITRNNLASKKSENVKEVHFKDKINVVENKIVSKEKYWLVESSIFVNENSFEYLSLSKIPGNINGPIESLFLFKEFSRIKGARIIAGDWFFESNGDCWIPLDKVDIILNQQQFSIFKKY